MKTLEEFLTLSEFVNTKRFTPDEIRKAIAIAKKMENDMTGATEAIENIKTGLSDHPKVAAALRKYNESMNESSEYHDQTFITSYNPDNLKFVGRQTHVDASELRFRPGKWPTVFKFKKKVGNGEAFRLINVRNMEYKIYMQDEGPQPSGGSRFKIQVWND